MASDTSQSQSKYYAIQEALLTDAYQPGVNLWIVSCDPVTAAWCPKSCRDEAADCVEQGQHVGHSPEE